MNYHNDTYRRIFKCSSQKKEKKMDLWLNWLEVAMELREAFSRKRTFMWFLVSLIGFSIRTDLMGVTSIVRSLALRPFCYDRLLDFFHSTAVDPAGLAKRWTTIVLKRFPLLTFDGKPVFVADGIKVPKAGKKMPAVKLLHQESESNTKPEYIMGHSFQSLGVLCGFLNGVFCVPLASRIHEGLKKTPRDKRTLLDKMVELLFDTVPADLGGVLVADAYYASKNVIDPLLSNGWRLVTRLRSNAVAYETPTEDTRPRGAGRKKVYGKKIHVRDLADGGMIEVESPVYGESGVMILYRCVDLLWRPVGRLVRFVIVLHPTRGRIFLLSTDITLSPETIISIYGLRFKIEVSFKQMARVLGGYLYHFWMKMMTPLKRGAGDTYVHKETKKYREHVERKVRAYHLFVQTAIVAQALMMYLALTSPKLVWRRFGSWMRTMNVDSIPSEFVVSTALRNTFPEFLTGTPESTNLKKFLMERIDFDIGWRIDMAA